MTVNRNSFQLPIPFAFRWLAKSSRMRSSHSLASSGAGDRLFPDRSIVPLSGLRGGDSRLERRLC